MRKLYMKQELIACLCRQSFKYSDEPIFKLVSGRMSQFYIDCKPVAMSPRGMYLIGHLIFDRIRLLRVAGIGGLTFGADPIAMAAAYTSEIDAGWGEGRIKRVSAFSIRKERKEHGTGKWIEGDLAPGQRVVIVDDVATTGGSTIKAIERARFEGLKVVEAIVLVDRQEGGLENIKAHVPASAIITRDELLTTWKNIQEAAATQG